MYFMKSGEVGKLQDSSKNYISSKVKVKIRKGDHKG